MSAEVARKPGAYRAHRPKLRTDWFRILADLQRKDYSNARVSSILDVPGSTLFGWKSGAEPPHLYGHQLLELWCEVTGLPMVQRPMVLD